MSTRGGARVNSGRKAKNPAELKNSRESEYETQLRIDSTPVYNNLPIMPDDMLEGEVVVWNEVINLYLGFFNATGIMPINALNVEMLRNYCMYTSLIRDLRRSLKKSYKLFVKKKTDTISSTNEGKARKGTSTQEKENPIFAAIIKFETRQSILAAQLNLTPDAINKMGLAIAKNKEDTLGSFLEGIDD